MTTSRNLSRVSFAAALSLSLAVAACATAGTGISADGLARAVAPSRSIPFENQGTDYVRVYLVGVREQWMLGRVEPGARATLRIPDEALADSSRSMWLSVQGTAGTAGGARTVTTAAAPVAILLAQRWTFSSRQSAGQIASLPLWRAEDKPPVVAAAGRAVHQ